MEMPSLSLMVLRSSSDASPTIDLDPNKPPPKRVPSSSIIAMVEEEGTRFGGGLLGSRSIVGDVSDEDLSTIKGKDGISIRAAMEEAQLNPRVPRKREG